MKASYVLILVLLISSAIFAQAPHSFSYQAVVRDAAGNPVTNQNVGFQISIISGSITGTVEYTETHLASTNAYGIVVLNIGTGIPVTGTFASISWGNNLYFIKIEADPTGGTSYLDMGTTQLLSVPYALHSKTAESITGTVTETDPVFVASPANGITSTDITSWNNKLDTEVDGSVTNEIQVLTISNDTVYLSNGGFVKLPAGFNGQYSSLTGAPTNVSSFTNDAGYLTTFTEIDGSVTNELQALSISNDTIRLTNGGFVKLPAGFSGQYSSLIGAPTNVSAFTNDAGYLTSFTEVDGSVTNELQVLSLSNDTIRLSNGGFVKLPAGFNGQYSSLTGAPTNVSAFTNDAGYLTSFTETDPKIGANTSGYSPKWNGSAMVTGAIYQDASNNVGIGTTTPSTKLEVSGQVKITGGTPGAGKILTSDAGGLASWQAAPGDNLGNHTATQNINLNGFALVSSGTRGLKMDSRGNIGINMAPQNTSGNDVNLDILSPDGWGHANVNLRGYNWATNSYKCTRGSGCDFYSGAWWSDTYNEHLFFLCSDGAEFAQGITMRKNSNVGIGTQAPSTKLHVNGVITATGGNSTNWNNAYGWGNHALAGYLTSYTELDTMLWKKNISDIYFKTGNVGIGTSTPTSKLSIEAATGNIGMNIKKTAGNEDFFQIINSSATKLMSIDYTGQLAYNVGASGPIYFGNFNNTTDGRAGFSTPFQVIMGIDAATHRFGIGGTGTYFVGNAPSSLLEIRGKANEVQLSIQANSTQTANLTEWRNASGTAINVINNTGNMGIGTTTPSTTLDVNGVITATGGNSNNWNTAYGWGNHASAGYLTSFSESDTMIWKKNSNDIYFSIGNVGIGTNAPSNKLSVTGSGNFTTSVKSPLYLPLDGIGNNLTMQTTDGATSTGSITIRSGDVSANGPTGGTLTLRGGNYTGGYKGAQLILQGYPGGNGGGNATLTGGDGWSDTGGDISLLAGNKGWGNGGSVYISGGNGGAGAGGAGHIVLNTGNDASVGPGLIMMRINGTEALRINSSRNVGMGLANPTAMLHIKGGSAGQPGKIKIEDADPTGLSSLELINNAGNTFYFYKLSSGYPANGRYTQGVSMIESNNANGLTLSEVTGDIHFYTGGNNERLTINNSGNIGIGTITPGAKLEVNGQVKITGGTPGAGKVLTSDAAGLASWQATGYAITHYIGESYGGGIVFYVYDNGQHGLIAATSDQSSSMRWNGGTNTNTMAYSDGIGAGKSNTAILIGNQGYGDGATYAARLCNEYSINVSGVIYSDWYLPSKTELNLLYLQKVIVGGFGGGNYWSSTEASITNCWGQTFSSGIQDSFGKADLYSVRAIRSF